MVQDSNRPSAGHLTPVRRHHWSALTRNWLLLCCCVWSSPLLSSPLVPQCCLVGLRQSLGLPAAYSVMSRHCHWDWDWDCTANTGLLLSTNYNSSASLLHRYLPSYRDITLNKLSDARA